MFNLGDPVVWRDQDRTLVGEVVGLRMSGSDALYDVSCETCTVKALFEDGLELASETVLQRELNAMLNAAVAGANQMPGRESRRRSILRNEHVMFLRNAHDRLRESTTEAHGISTSFSIGERVALHENGAYELCVVSGMRRQDGDVLVQVDCMGDVRLVCEGDLLQLSETPKSSKGLALGGRARFVVAGREDDESYEGVICRVEHGEGDGRFSLAFDDGDVFEDLDAADLRPCVVGSALF